MRRFFAARSELPAVKEPLCGSCPGVAPIVAPFILASINAKLPVIHWHYRPTDAKNAKIKSQHMKLSNSKTPQRQKEWGWPDRYNQ
jgi:hypothetical protein